MFIKRDVRSRHAYRTSSLFLCFILSSWKWTDMVPEIIIQVEFLLCFHAPSFYFDREIKGEYLALRYLKTAKLERTAENRKTWAFLCMGARVPLFCFFFVFFYKRGRIACIQRTVMTIPTSVFHILQKNIQGVLESPFSSEVISSIKLTPYFLRKHLGHHEDNRSFTGFNDFNDLPIIPIAQENVCQ